MENRGWGYCPGIVTQTKFSGDVRWSNADASRRDLQLDTRDIPMPAPALDGKRTIEVDDPGRGCVHGCLASDVENLF